MSFNYCKLQVCVVVLHITNIWILENPHFSDRQTNFPFKSLVCAHSDGMYVRIFCVNARKCSKGGRLCFKSLDSPFPSL